MAEYRFESVERFTVGAIGEPGQRVFMVQIVGEGRTLTIKTEKGFVRELCERFGSLLEDVAHFEHLPEELDLTGPFDIDWNMGAVSVEWNMSIDKFELRIVDFDTAFGGDDESSATDEVRFDVTKEQLAAWAIRGRLLVEAGRPPCPLCGHPLDANGHACPRSNGNRPPGP